MLHESGVEDFSPDGKEDQTTITNVEFKID